MDRPQICSHTSYVIHGTKRYCTRCGLNIPKKDQDDRAFKSPRYNYVPHLPPEAYISTIRRKQNASLQMSQLFLELRPRIVDYIYTQGNKLAYSCKSIQLAVRIVDKYVSLKGFKGHMFQYQVLALAALLLAGKASEMDENVPFISKMREILGFFHETSVIKKTELDFCKVLRWDLHLPCLIDFIDYYLSQGVLFSSDKFGCESLTKLVSYSSLFDRKLGEEKICSFIAKFEDEVIFLTNLIAKDGELMSGFSLDMLASTTILFMRKHHDICPFWNDHLQCLSGFPEFLLGPCLIQLEGKFGQSIPLRKPTSVKGLRQCGSIKSKQNEKIANNERILKTEENLPFDENNYQGNSYPAYAPLAGHTCSRLKGCNNGNEVPFYVRQLQEQTATNRGENRASDLVNLKQIVSCTLLPRSAIESAYPRFNPIKQRINETTFWHVSHEVSHTTISTLAAEKSDLVNMHDKNQQASKEGSMNAKALRSLVRLMKTSIPKDDNNIVRGC